MPPFEEGRGTALAVEGLAKNAQKPEVRGDLTDNDNPSVSFADSSLSQGSLQPPFEEGRGTALAVEGLAKNARIDRTAATCCGARCASCRQSGCVAHRPLPLAQVALSATGGASFAPPSRKGG